LSQSTAQPAPEAPDAPIDTALQAVVDGMHLEDACRHVFICVGSGKCAPLEQCEAAWDHLKRRLRDAGVVDVRGAVLRTRAGCLRVCREGPIALVHPGGYWYRKASGENLDRIIDEHLLGGRPVRELLIAEGPLDAHPE
jgi:(2Fe-2S) ferredoxin